MNVQLSKRMQAVADMALPGYRVADVGCDHGFVSIYLIQSGIASHVYAADVRPGPLSRAREHIRQAGLEDYITPVLSDGLSQVPDQAQAMIAAGIGGRLTIKILSDHPEKTGQLAWMVLEPQSDIHLVRQWIAEHGFQILKENMVFEDGKYYPILFAVNEKDAAWTAQIAQMQQRRNDLQTKWQQEGFDAERCQEACDLFGMENILSAHPVLEQYLAHTMEKDAQLLKEMEAAADSDRIRQRMEEISCKGILYAQVSAFIGKLAK